MSQRRRWKTFEVVRLKELASTVVDCVPAFLQSNWMLPAKVPILATDPKATWSSRDSSSRLMFVADVDHLNVCELQAGRLRLALKSLLGPPPGGKYLSMLIPGKRRPCTSTIEMTSTECGKAQRVDRNPHFRTLLWASNNEKRVFSTGAVSQTLILPI